MKFDSSYKRLLLKLSGEAFMGRDGAVYDVSRIGGIVKSVGILQSRGYEIVMVCGGGNIWRYRDMKHLNLSRVDSDCLGIMATSMNASVFASSCKLAGIDARSYVSPGYMIPEHSYLFSTRDTQEYLNTGGIVICGGGTGEPFATTDSAGVLRGLELSCDIVVKCSTVDGVYDKDPRKHDDAVKYDSLTHEQAVKKGLKVMDQAALGLARQENIDICVCHMDTIHTIGTDDWTGTIISSES